MPSVTVYTREDCHLCAEAVDTLERVAADCGVADALDLDLVDVDADPDLREAYGDRVPYVLVDGVPRFKYRVDEAKLRRLFEEGS